MKRQAEVSEIPNALLDLLRRTECQHFGRRRATREEIYNFTVAPSLRRQIEKALIEFLC